MSLLATVLVILSACAGGPEVGDVKPQSLTGSQGTPAEPPKVSIERQVIAPTYFEWEINGKPVRFKSAPEQNEVEPTEISLRDAERIRISVGSTTLPTDFSVVVFDTVDSHGVPQSSEGHITDCLRETTCDISETPDGLEANVELPPGALVVVVHLMYVDIRGTGDQTEVVYFTGSWAASTTERSRDDAKRF